VTLKLAMPLKPGITSADFDVSAEAKLVDGRIRNAIEGVDLESATIDISLQDTVITGKGKAKLGDKQARISWRRPLTKSANADEDLTLAATLTDRDRQKLGINLDPYLVGPTPVEVTMVRRGGEIVSARVKADLSKTRMELDALGWSRAPTKGTKASFAVDMGDGKVIKINDLELPATT
jgi:hypothetical protein